MPKLKEVIKTLRDNRELRQAVAWEGIVIAGALTLCSAANLRIGRGMQEILGEYGIDPELAAIPQRMISRGITQARASLVTSAVTLGGLIASNTRARRQRQSNRQETIPD